MNHCIILCLLQVGDGYHVFSHHLLTYNTKPTLLREYYDTDIGIDQGTTYGTLLLDVQFL